MPENTPSLPDFTRWPSFPFEGDMRVKNLAEPVAVEPPRSGEDAADCVACNTDDDAYIWVSERWRVRSMDRPTGLPMVLILECRSHLDIGDLTNLLAAELGVMTVRLERAIRSLDGVARVHVNRWGDGSAHLHMWFLARPYGRLQLRGTFLSLWDDILPVIPEEQWLNNLAHVAAWLAEFGGRAIAEPSHINWLSPSTFSNDPQAAAETTGTADAWRPTDLADAESDTSKSDTVRPSELNEAAADTRDLSSYKTTGVTPLSAEATSAEAPTARPAVVETGAAEAADPPAAAVAGAAATADEVGDPASAPDTDLMRALDPSDHLPAVGAQPAAERNANDGDSTDVSATESGVPEVAGAPESVNPNCPATPEGKADQGDAGQGDAGQGDAGQGDADQGDADQGDAGYGGAGQGVTGQGGVGQSGVGQGGAGEGGENPDGVGPGNAGLGSGVRSSANQDEAGQGAVDQRGASQGDADRGDESEDDETGTDQSAVSSGAGPSVETSALNEVTGEVPLVTGPNADRPSSPDPSASDTAAAGGPVRLPSGAIPLQYRPTEPISNDQHPTAQPDAADEAEDSRNAATH